MIAKYRGRCGLCHRPISRGDSIQMDWGRAFHSSCLGKPPAFLDHKDGKQPPTLTQVEEKRNLDHIIHRLD